VYNRLIQYAEGNKRESYTYDAEGVRRSKENGDDTIYYISDTTGSLSYTLAETDKNGNVIATYNRADALISQVRDETTSYYLFDGHGDVRALINEEGRISDKYRYNAYGELVERSGETENHYLYTGEYYDGTSNLYYLRARYINPSTGTFISMDTYEGSIYDPDTLHKYLYANGNPVKYSDPSGMFSISEAQIASGMQAVLNAMPRILYSGAISGLTSCIATALTGGTFKESMISLATGFAVGSGLMVVQYFCIAAEIASVAKMLLLTVGTIDTCFSLLIAIRSIAERSPMQIIQYSIMTILGAATVCQTWNMDFSTLVIGQDGSITINYDSTCGTDLVVGTGKNGGKENSLALGLSDYLDDFAENTNSHTWKDFQDNTNWQQGVIDALNDPNVDIVFNLDGIDDSWAAVMRASRGAGGATDWELLQIKLRPDTWEKITWYLDGEIVTNPFE